MKNNLSRSKFLLWSAFFIYPLICLIFNSSIASAQKWVSEEKRIFNNSRPVLVLYDGQDKDIKNVFKAYMKAYRELEDNIRPTIYVDTLQNFLKANVNWSLPPGLSSGDTVNVHIIAHGYEDQPMIQIRSNEDLEGQFRSTAKGKIKDFLGDGLGETFADKIRNAGLFIDTIVLNCCYQALNYKSERRGMMNFTANFYGGLEEKIDWTQNGKIEVWAPTGEYSVTQKRLFSLIPNKYVPDTLLSIPDPEGIIKQPVGVKGQNNNWIKFSSSAIPGNVPRFQGNY